MDGNFIFWYTRSSSYSLHICIAVSAHILHLTRTRSSDSYFGFNSTHRPIINFIIILNGVFHEQQLLIIVVNVMLHVHNIRFFIYLFFEMEAPNVYYSNVFLVGVE